VPALSVEIVKQSHDTKGSSILPRAGWAVMLRGGLKEVARFVEHVSV